MTALLVTERARYKGLKMAFRVLIIGGTGEVGAAVVRALAAEPSCAEVVMVNRRAISLTADPCLRQVIMIGRCSVSGRSDQACAEHGCARRSCLWGILCWRRSRQPEVEREEELKALEIGVVGGFARGCHAGGITRFALLSAAGAAEKAGFAMRGSWG